MQDILNRSSGRAAQFLDPIRVTEVAFGDQYPLFSNARIRPADDAGRMRVEVDVDYADHITMAIETKLVINFPRPRFAVLPISLSLTIARFSGTVSPTPSLSGTGADRSHSSLSSYSLPNPEPFFRANADLNRPAPLNHALGITCTSPYTQILPLTHRQAAYLGRKPNSMTCRRSNSFSSAGCGLGFMTSSSGRGTGVFLFQTSYRASRCQPTRSRSRMETRTQLLAQSRQTRWKNGQHRHRPIRRVQRRS